MKVQIIVEVDVPDQDTAESWIGSCFDMASKCTACDGRRYTAGSIWDRKECTTCQGSGFRPDGHPYKPRVLSSKVVPSR